MKLAVFIDYDNLLESHKGSGILDVVTKALIQSPINLPDTRGTCDVRIYGGWYEGILMTQLAQDVTVAIQGSFPAVIRLSGIANQGISLIAGAELAVALFEEPAHHMFNTYRKKGKPANIRVQTPEVIGCADAACPLRPTRKLLKTGKCPTAACLIAADDLVYRHEQKLVDTMLTCDIIYATQLGYDRVILISGDDDFLPPLRTALLRGASVIRFHPKPGQSRASFPRTGEQLVEMDL